MGQASDKVMQMARLGLEIPLYINSFKSVGYCMILNPKLIGLKMKDLINYTVIEKINKTKK